MRGFSSIVLAVVGGILALLGLGLAGGGAYLLTLGGSWFYLPAGLALVGVGYGLFKRRAFALPLALALLAVSGIWSFWEVGSDFWQLVPRLVTFIVVALVAAAGAPWLLKADGQAALRCKPAGGLAVVLALVVVGIFAGMFQPHPTVVADSDAAAPVLDAQAGAADGDDWTAYGRNTHGDRFGQFDQINKANVKDPVSYTHLTLPTILLV